MNTLIDVVRMPIVRLDGGIVEQPGYDSVTKLYGEFDPDQLGEIAHRPSDEMLTEALRAAWLPWSLYRWATPDDKAAALSMVVTLVFRGVLELCPGFFSDAPTQSSGKTAVVTAAGVIITGRRVALCTKSGGRDGEVELAKRFVSAIVAGDPVWIVDNVTGVFDSAAIAAWLTNGVPGERLLGVNQHTSGPFRAMLLVTGNNACLSADMATRLVQMRINTGRERPQAEVFAFDPTDCALETRWDVIHGLLTLVRGWVDAGGSNRPVPRGSRFVAWSRTACSLVRWLRDSGIARSAGLGDIGEPDVSLLGAQGVVSPDEEALGRMLEHLDETFGGCPFQSAQVLVEYRRGRGAVFESLNWLLREPRHVTAQSITFALRIRRDKIVGGRSLALYEPDEMTILSSRKKQPLEWVVRRHV